MKDRVMESEKMNRRWERLINFNADLQQLNHWSHQPVQWFYSFHNVQDGSLLT